MAYVYKKKLKYFPVEIEVWGNIYGPTHGYSVAVDGYYCVIGTSTTNSWYIYKKGVNGDWNPLKGVSHLAGDGSSLDICKDVSVFGLRNYNAGIGRVVFFDKDLGGVDNWGETVAIGDGGCNVGDYFGYSVATNGTYAVGGAPGVDESKGVVIFYEKAIGLGNWVRADSIGINGRITPDSDQTSGDYFGCSCSMDGDYLVVGSKNEDGKKGAAYIFYKDENGENKWGQQQRIISSDRKEKDLFGYSVSISGDYLVIGARGKERDDERGAGAAYIFQRSVDTWYEIEKLVSPLIENKFNYYFGNSVNIDGDLVVIGSPGAKENMGVADIYSKEKNWEHLQELSPFDGTTGDEGQFGYSVALSGSFCIAGSPFGGRNPSFEDEGFGYMFEETLPVLRLAQEFNVGGEYIPSKASVYLKRIGKNISDFWTLYDNEKNVIDATNFSSITQKSNKVIFDDTIGNFTGNGYMILSPRDELEIVKNRDEDFSIINFPIKSENVNRFRLLIRGLVSSPDPSGELKFKVDILLDGVVIDEIKKDILYNEWNWFDSILTMPDQNEHILGIRLKEKSNAIDKIYLDTDDSVVGDIYFEGPAYSTSPYVTVHLKIHDSDGTYPTEPLLIYDYKTTMGEIRNDDWYNFNINLLDSRLDNPSAFIDECFIVMSTTGGGNENFVIWEMVDGDEYIPLSSAIKI